MLKSFVKATCKFLAVMAWVSVIFSIFFGSLAMLRPEWFVGEWVLDRVADSLRQEGLLLEWRAARLELESISFSKKRLRLLLIDPTLRDPGQGPWLGARELEVGLRFRLRPVEALRNRSLLGLVGDFHDLRLDARELRGSGWKADFTLASSEGWPEALELRGEFRSSGFAMALRARALAGDSRADPAGATGWKSKHWEIHPSGTLRGNGWSLGLESGCFLKVAIGIKRDSASERESQVATDCPVAFRGRLAPPEPLAALLASLPIPRASARSEEGQGSAATGGGGSRKFLQGALRARVVSDWRILRFFPAPDVPWEGELRVTTRAFGPGVLRVEPFLVTARARWVPAEVSHGLKFLAGFSHETSNAWWLQASFRGRARLADFAAAERVLRGTRFAVPAPWNALDGKLQVDFRGDWSSRNRQVDFVAQTFLAASGSGRQRFRTVTHGRLRPRLAGERIASPDGVVPALTAVAPGPQRPGGSPWTLSLVADTELLEVVLALPRLGLERPPRLTPDPRIRTGEEKRIGGFRSGDPGWEVSWRIRTSRGRPISLLSNLAKKPVPLALDLRIGPAGELVGLVELFEFPLSLYRRDAMLERLRFELGHREEVFGESLGRVLGALRLRYADYLVRAEVSGPLELPRLTLSSDPPLPEGQLYAVLLFGRPLEELEADEGISVGSLRSAVADGALGFASLFLLASTPVESVGYDPATGFVSAKIRLGEGTSLRLGRRGAEGGAAQRIGLRRRLSRSWTLITDWTQASDSLSQEGSGLSAFLEWVRRY